MPRAGTSLTRPRIVRENMLDLSDFAWQRLRTRVEGLTDDEYFWEPFADCWTVRKTADGSFQADWSQSPPDPPPFTTLASRIRHVSIDILQAGRTVDAGGVAAGNEAEAEWAKVESELDANGPR